MVGSSCPISAVLRQSMKPTTTILIGAPLSREEARFLRILHADLEGTESLILANFIAGKRQIDFVVVTHTYAAILELKNFARPICGQQRNGVWDLSESSGQANPLFRRKPVAADTYTKNLRSVMR